MSAHYDRLVRWRDIGDGPLNYGAGSLNFANDVKLLLEERDRLATQHKDMLEALIEARDMLEAYERDLTGETFNSPKINAAIAKAEGRS